MNFINAILHAGIGYGIRRSVWGKNAHLIMNDDNELHWSPHTMQGITGSSLCELLGDDDGFHLLSHDIKATDWEVV